MELMDCDHLLNCCEKNGIKPTMRNQTRERKWKLRLNFLIQKLLENVYVVNASLKLM
jgi:hypothetical protein